MRALLSNGAHLPAHSLAGPTAEPEAGAEVLSRHNDRPNIDAWPLARPPATPPHSADEAFRSIFNANPLAISLQSPGDGRFVDVNPAFLALTGYARPEVVARTAADFRLWTDPDMWAQIVESLRANTPLRSTPVRLRRKDGRMRSVLLWVERVEVSGDALVLATIEDATDRVLLQEQSQQAQKMEAVGQVAAGIAHDFNNLLTVIQSYAALVLDDPTLTTGSREDLMQVKMAAGRAAALTRQLLIFSRRQFAQREPLDVAALVSNLHEMLRRVIPEHIALEWTCPPSLPLVMADAANLEQVVMNLVVNARDALANGGRIVLSAARVIVTGAEAHRHPDARPGDYVRLVAADNGPGIPPEVLPHIFEPFFTTKGHKGTGLGLSTVYAIVRQHDGWIEVDSDRTGGTRFEIFLPALHDSEANAPTDAPADMVPPAGFGETILLVEDEETVRVAARSILERAGYAVIEATDAPTALQRWVEAPRPFDLLLTDMVMPKGTNGLQLAVQLRARRPALRVIIATGYSQELLRQDAPSVPGARLVGKPFTAAALLAAVRETLDAAQ